MADGRHAAAEAQPPEPAKPQASGAVPRELSYAELYHLTTAQAEELQGMNRRAPPPSPPPPPSPCRQV